MKQEDKARNEAAERRHFNEINRNVGVRYDPELRNHPDYRIIHAGLRKLVTDGTKNCLLVGCGTAAEAWYISRKCRHVYAVDIAEHALYAAIRGAKEAGFSDKVSYLAGSGYTLPLKKASIDFIYGHAVLHHFDIPKLGPELNVFCLGCFPSPVICPAP